MERNDYDPNVEGGLNYVLKSDPNGLMGKGFPNSLDYGSGIEVLGSTLGLVGIEDIAVGDVVDFGNKTAIVKSLVTNDGVESMTIGENEIPVGGVYGVVVRYELEGIIPEEDMERTYMLYDGIDLHGGSYAALVPGSFKIIRKGIRDGVPNIPNILDSIDDFQEKY